MRDDHNTAKITGLTVLGAIIIILLTTACGVDRKYRDVVVVKKVDVPEEVVEAEETPEVITYITNNYHISDSGNTTTTVTDKSDHRNSGNTDIDNRNRGRSEVDSHDRTSVNNSQDNDTHVNNSQDNDRYHTDNSDSSTDIDDSFNDNSRTHIKKGSITADESCTIKEINHYKSEIRCDDGSSAVVHTLH